MVESFYIDLFVMWFGKFSACQKKVDVSGEVEVKATFINRLPNNLNQSINYYTEQSDSLEQNSLNADINKDWIKQVMNDINKVPTLNHWS